MGRIAAGADEVREKPKGARMHGEDFGSVCVFEGEFVYHASSNDQRSWVWIKVPQREEVARRERSSSGEPLSSGCGQVGGTKQASGGRVWKSDGVGFVCEDELWSVDEQVGLSCLG
jgi:hypothetical protein